MATNSKIEWTTHTFNPWRGCTKVSAGCSNCYADTLSKRNPGTLGIWGPNGTRVVASETTWREPLKWNRLAQCECGAAGKRPGECEWCAGGGVRPRVFCASLADVFEDWTGAMLDAKGDRLCIYKPNGGLLSTRVYAEEPPANCRWLTMQDIRKRLFDLIDATPNLDWLLLTKRPENIAKMMPLGHVGDQMFASRPNVWLGVSVENQEQADKRIPELLKVPAAVRFLSCEPLLGSVDLSRPLGLAVSAQNQNAGVRHLERFFRSELNWVIIGGESGHGARPCVTWWIRSLISQCSAASVPVFVKQLGSRSMFNELGFAIVPDERMGLKDKKGGDMSEWPKDLCIREFPVQR